QAGQVRVRRRLAQDKACLGTDRVRQRRDVSGGEQRGLYPEARQSAGHKLPRSAVAVLEEDDVLSPLQHREQRGGDGGHAAREEEGVLGPFQGRQPLLNRAAGGVAVSTVLFPIRVLVVPLDEAFDLRAVFERVRRGLHDRRRDRVVRLVLRLARV